MTNAQNQPNSQKTTLNTESMQTQPHYPAISIGVITHEKRAQAFQKLLAYMAKAVEHYPGQCELVIGNNSGEQFHHAVEQSVEQSGLRQYLPCTVFDSPQNNIAVGRNVVMAHAQHQHLAFIDDDEYPTEQWLTALMDAMQQLQCSIVAGPITPVYDSSTKDWVKTVDIHNARGLNNLDAVEFVATGNFLIDRSCIQGVKFNENYGKSGGSDTEYFLRLRDAGATLHWATNAEVMEDIPANRSTVQSTVNRCLNQGKNYRRIMQERGEIKSKPVFLLKAAAVFAVSLPIGVILMLIKHPDTGHWIKRAFSNLGKLYSPSKMLYD